MLHPNPEQRWTVAQIKGSAWYAEDPEPMPEAEVIAGMKARRHATKEAKRAKKAAKGEKKGGYTRAVGDEDAQYDDEDSLEALKKMKKYNKRTSQLLDTILLTNEHPLSFPDKFMELQD